MNIPLKSNRLSVAESIVDGSFDALPDNAKEILLYADLLGLPLGASEAEEVLECFQRIRALSVKGVIVDAGRWCGAICEHLKQTRGQRLVTDLESLRELGGTHVMQGAGDKATLMTVAEAISEFERLDDNAFGLGQHELGRTGLYECDIEGCRILRSQTIAKTLAVKVNSVMICDDGGEWYGYCKAIAGSPEIIGTSWWAGVAAEEVPAAGLDRVILERALILAGNTGSVSDIGQSFRINDDSYLFTFRIGS